jgi:cobalt/nickel transport system ATP-binding protein
VTAAPLVEARALAVARDGRAVLREVDLTLADGERVFIDGPIGAGKSTLLLALIGLLPRQAGSVRLFGRPCDGESDFAPLRGPVGLLFQDPDDQLLGPTVLEDVEFGPLNRGADAQQAHRAAEAALQHVACGHLLSRPVHALSGGEKRLVALAGLLAMQPRVLLLDEPTAALDADAARRVTDALAATGLPMIVASHDAACAARLATRRLTLADGRLQSLA